MALHCNFQGLVAESDSDRDPGNGCFLRGQRRVRAALLPSGCYLKAQVNFTLAAAAHALNNGQNILWVQLVDVLMIDADCTDVMWPHAWNSVCGSSHHRFLLVCERLVNNIQSGIQEALVLQRPQHTQSLWEHLSCTGYSHLCNGSTGSAPTLSMYDHKHQKRPELCFFLFKSTATHNQHTHTHVKANMWSEHQEGRGLNTGGGGRAN